MRIGTAGWTIPKAFNEAFGAGGTHLERYARRLTAVEINSSFYRPHKPATYARWSASVPEEFRFAVKLPREITHTRRLIGTQAVLERFLSEVSALGEKLGPLLVQLPPSLRFDHGVTADFLKDLRDHFDGQVVCEPRHPSWFADPAETLLTDFRVGRVAADPAPVPRAGVPAGALDPVYWRLHGSPEMYYSKYSDDFLDRIIENLQHSDAAERWCIFDNTALGAATGDALTVHQQTG